jgi:hypothetical protein
LDIMARHIGFQEDKGRAEAAARQLTGALESGGRTARRAAQALEASAGRP